MSSQNFFYLQAQIVSVKKGSHSVGLYLLHSTIT